jgi:hypothetical protein
MLGSVARRPVSTCHRTALAPANSTTKEPTMNRSSRFASLPWSRATNLLSMKRLMAALATTVLLSGGVVGVVGISAGTGQAQPGPAPQRAWPGCPDDHPEGPCHWCPGDPTVQTGNLRVNPVVWDWNVCHTYWYVPFGQGNVAQNIFEGDAPPPPPPPPPPPIISGDQCRALNICGLFP